MRHAYKSAKNSQKLGSEQLFLQNIFWGGMPPDPLAKVAYAAAASGGISRLGPQSGTPSFEFLHPPLLYTMCTRPVYLLMGVYSYINSNIPDIIYTMEK